MNLVIDIGNSRTKAAILHNGEILERWSFPEPGQGDVKAILEKYPDTGRCIVSSTRAEKSPVEDFLSAAVPFFLRMTGETPVPLRNLYRTPSTLGTDRMAAAVGANILFPGENLMIADLGTALTIDFVTAGGEFLGGSISPGAGLRFRALHENTGKLPMGSLDDAVEGIAGSTAEAISAGVANGIFYELDGYRREYSQKMPGLILILTGGNADFFVKRFKNTIFANYDLATIGLNRILDYNAPEQDNS